MRAPQAWTTPTDRRGQLGTAARADGLIDHGDTLLQFHTDEKLLSRSDLNARGVWFVGWSKAVGGGALWWAGCGCGAGCVGRVKDWETGDVDK
jgi:hypothetical protein